MFSRQESSDVQVGVRDNKEDPEHVCTAGSRIDGCVLDEEIFKTVLRVMCALLSFRTHWGMPTTFVRDDSWSRQAWSRPWLASHTGQVPSATARGTRARVSEISLAGFSPRSRVALKPLSGFPLSYIIFPPLFLLRLWL